MVFYNPQLTRLPPYKISPAPNKLNCISPHKFNMFRDSFQKLLCLLLEEFISTLVQRYLLNHLIVGFEFDEPPKKLCRKSSLYSNNVTSCFAIFIYFYFLFLRAPEIFFSHVLQLVIGYNQSKCTNKSKMRYFDFFAILSLTEDVG